MTQSPQQSQSQHQFTKQQFQVKHAQIQEQKEEQKVEQKQEQKVEQAQEQEVKQGTLTIFFFDFLLIFLYLLFVRNRGTIAP